jgi:hypothetical protein
MKVKSGGGWQANLPKKSLAPSRGLEKHKGWDQGWDDKPISQSGTGGESQSWSHGTQGNFQNWIALPCWGRSWPELQLYSDHSCHLVKITIALTTLHKLEELPQLQIATCPVNRKNQILLTSQSLGETTSELLLVHQYQDWTSKE